MYSPFEMIGAAVFRQASPRFGEAHLDTDHVSGRKARNANILGLRARPPQGPCFVESETGNAS
jgi:hypothetical protein